MFRSFAFLLALCAAAGGQSAPLRPEVDPARVLFLGNSITRHGPAPKIGWTGDWGMAASAIEKDYVHKVSLGLAERANSAKLDVRISNIADFERNPGTFDLEVRLKLELEFKPTLVIVAIGENVPALQTEEAKAQFAASLQKLFAALKKAGPSTLLVRGCFWPDPAKDAVLEKTCADAGGRFVSIAALGKDESNYARAERKIEHAGVAAHPGDKGMSAIADAILAALSR